MDEEIEALKASIVDCIDARVALGVAESRPNHDRSAGMSDLEEHVERADRELGEAISGLVEALQPANGDAPEPGTKQPTQPGRRPAGPR